MITKNIKNFQYLASEKTDWQEIVAGLTIIGLLAVALALSL